VLINGKWQQADTPAGSFHAVNPAIGQPLDLEFPVSSQNDLDAALDAAYEVVARGTLTPDRIADFLDAYADCIAARENALVQTAHLETALGEEPRLRTIELPRTISQLRQAALAARECSWCCPTLDIRANIRSKYGPLDGPVVIFGPGNFPFAYNAISGGDFAAGIAAGNPVIAKANPGHPATTKILAEAALEALADTHLPEAAVQLVYHVEPDVGCGLVAHPLVGACAFTGSREAGLKLKQAADLAGKPIYLEMSSINPVFILPNCLDQRLQEIANAFVESCLMGAGQFCTNPGLVILVQDPAVETFIQTVLDKLKAALCGTLLGIHGVEQIDAVVQKLRQCGAEVLTGGRPSSGPGFGYENTLLRISGKTFLGNPDVFQNEAFGSVSLHVVAEDFGQMLEIAGQLKGNLTGTIYSREHETDDALYNRLEPVLRRKVGRLINNKMPTGVTLSPAMNHGGPFPATGHPGFTAVGMPASILRFGALHAYDNVRHDRLPKELRDENPTGKTWRWINGSYTIDHVSHKTKET